MSRVVNVLGSGPVATAMLRLTRNRLRILTYHGIPDAGQFSRQLDYLAGSGFTTVTGAEVSSWLAGTELGPRPVWITFDDGDPTVIDVGLPEMVKRGMRATAFVCPGVVGTTQAHWWDIAERARRHPQLAAETPPNAELKTVDDQSRRRIIEELSTKLDGAGESTQATQWSADDLNNWLAAGQEVGNHTWDHPCLDRCSPAEAANQVRSSHDRLVELTGLRPNVFAWPNGNEAPTVLPMLEELGYSLVLRCDHRLTSRAQPANSLSRLAIDSDASLARFRAILAGGHSGVFHITRSLRRRSHLLKS